MTEATIHRNAEDDIAALKREVATLRQAQVQYNAAAPLVLCLIDGDGCIFNKRLLELGTEGGREAASKLRWHVITHYGSSQDLLVNVFFNREGLGKVINTHLGISPETFNAFILGFNTASPLMSMLDVGTGKEAADAKIRVKRIYFGGGHDNGYVPNLMAIQNEGYLNKIVLLQSYSQPAAGIDALDLPSVENNDIFLSEKLPPRQNPTTSRSGGERSKTIKGVVPLPSPGPSVHTCLDVHNHINNPLLGLEAQRMLPVLSHQKGMSIGGACWQTHPTIFFFDFFLLVLPSPPAVTDTHTNFLKTCSQTYANLQSKNHARCPQGLSCKRHKENKCKFSAFGTHELPVLLVNGPDHEAQCPNSSPTLPNHVRDGSSPEAGGTFDLVPVGQHTRDKSQLGVLSAQNGRSDPASVRQTPSLDVSQQNKGGPSTPALDRVAAQHRKAIETERAYYYFLTLPEFFLHPDCLNTYVIIRHLDDPKAKKRQ
ncbi:hypothetical protein FRC10_006974 [Ceratobasidium sp. 414]|nr:hypothetical protein FRC10_006974 [Ceratobasidium sp. 414]